MSLLIKIASTTSLSPLITLKTPSGNPASFNNSANLIEHDGSFSDGFNTKVFPQAIAIGNIHIGTIAGKLNGVIPAQTPSGCLTDQLSISVPTFSVNSPFKTWGIPHANSTTSKPFFALSTASSKSDFEPSFTSDSCSPVAGLNILPFLSDFPGVIFPFTKCWIKFIAKII